MGCTWGCTMGFRIVVSDGGFGWWFVMGRFDIDCREVKR
jgi:hypothetical protein